MLLLRLLLLLPLVLPYPPALPHHHWRAHPRAPPRQVFLCSFTLKLNTIFSMLSDARAVRVMAGRKQCASVIAATSSSDAPVFAPAVEWSIANHTRAHGSHAYVSFVYGLRPSYKTIEQALILRESVRTADRNASFVWFVRCADVPTMRRMRMHDVLLLPITDADLDGYRQYLQPRQPGLRTVPIIHHHSGPLLMWFKLSFPLWPMPLPFLYLDVDIVATGPLEALWAPADDAHIVYSREKWHLNSGALLLSSRPANWSACLGHGMEVLLNFSNPKYTRWIKNPDQWVLDWICREGGKRPGCTVRCRGYDKRRVSTGCSGVRHPTVAFHYNCMSHHKLALRMHYLNRTSHLLRRPNTSLYSPDLRAALAHHPRLDDDVGMYTFLHQKNRTTRPASATRTTWSSLLGRSI